MLSGAGLAPKELQALQSELEVLAKRQGDLEEIELDAMQRLEDAEAAATRVIMQIDAVAAKVADITARLNDADADIEATHRTVSGLERGWPVLAYPVEAL